MTASGIHAGRPVLRAGPALEAASAVAIMVHGRGGSARDILSLVPEIGVPGLAAIAPQAAGSTWYPFSFMAPIDQNEPALSSALSVLSALVDDVETHGVPAERILVLGFSQGACLASEFVARSASRFGALAGLTGGLIGPEGAPRDYTGDLTGMPVFLGSSDPDPHVPWSRVLETASVLEAMGAAVDLRRYPGMGHTINGEEIDAVRVLADGMAR